MLPPARSRGRRRLLAVVAGVLLAGAASPVVAARLGPQLAYTGPDDGAVLGAAAVDDLTIAVEADGAGTLADAVLTVDGVVPPDLERNHRAIRWQPTAIDDGAHEVRVELPADFPAPPRSRTWRFTVDQTAPELVLDPIETVRVGDQPVTITGRADPEVTVTVDGLGPERDDDGSFRIVAADPPDGPVEVVATDAAGNVASERLEFVTIPSRVMVDTIRGVHVTAAGWQDPERRAEVIGLARAGRINAVQLDLKDEEGYVGFDTQNELAAELGARRPFYDLDEAVAELHDLGVEIVGRIVVFRDGLFARHAWAAGRHDDVVQTADGRLYTGSYEGFGNIASESVWDYNIDLAEEAAAAGVDNILWDYVRKPDGRMANFIFPGLDETVEPERAAQDAVLAFIATADRRLARYDVKHGASVYGVAATRPHEIAQDVRGMARHLDYVAPMVYPSHWAPGEFGVSDPNAEPGLIVQRSLVGFVDEVEGTDAEIVPWLQDFPWPIPYTPAMVREQIAGAAAVGVDQWLMWNAGVYYQDSAYDVITEAGTAAEDAERR